MSSNLKFKSDSIENDYGVFSIEEPVQLNDKRRVSSISLCNSNYSISGRSSNDNRCEVAPTIKSTSHHVKSNHFRMIVCGDSGKYVQKHNS